MNRLLNLSILILLFICSCKKEAPLVDEIDGSFNTLSYNVAGLPKEISSSKPHIYTSLISPHLNDFDIVHVQEDFCYHDSLILFNQHTSVTNPSPCVPDGDGLNTMTNFNINCFERITWNDCAGFDCLTPKGFSYSKIELHRGVFIDFYNVHCNAGGGDDDKEARRKNLFQLVDYIETNSKDEAIIIMGDFNHRYTRDGDSTRLMLTLGYSEPWIDIITDGIIPDIDSSGRKDCYPISTSTTCEGVDKIFYRSSEEMKIEATSYQYGDDSRFYYQGIDSLPLSDHAPLMVDFSYDFKRK